MKKLLLLSSLFVMLVAWACNNRTVPKSEKTEWSDNGKEVKHGGPNQARLDSLKEAKTKKKQ